jgi:hypothetical protein
VASSIRHRAPATHIPMTITYTHPYHIAAPAPNEQPTGPLVHPFAIPPQRLSPPISQHRPPTHALSLPSDYLPNKWRTGPLVHLTRAPAATITHTHPLSHHSEYTAPIERPTGPLVLFAIASQRLSSQHPCTDHPHMPCRLPMTTCTQRVADRPSPPFNIAT